MNCDKRKGVAHWGRTYLLIKNHGIMLVTIEAGLILHKSLKKKRKITFFHFSSPFFRLSARLTPFCP